jgi:hypothetical protein
MNITALDIFATMDDGTLRRVMLDPQLEAQIRYLIPSATNGWRVSETLYNPSSFGGKQLVVKEGVPVSLLAGILDSYFDGEPPPRRIGQRNGAVMKHNQTYYYVYETTTTIVVTKDGEEVKP